MYESVERIIVDVGQSRISTSTSAAEGRADQPADPVSPQAAGPAVPEREVGAGGVSGCSGMPGSEKVQPARQSSRIQGGLKLLLDASCLIHRVVFLNNGYNHIESLQQK